MCYDTNSETLVIFPTGTGTEMVATKSANQEETPTVKIARLITWALIVLAVLLWLAIIVCWFMTEPGFEPINVLVHAILSSLTAVFGWLLTLKKKEAMLPYGNQITF
jgi:bacteriorhodopsin